MVYAQNKTLILPSPPYGGLIPGRGSQRFLLRMVVTMTKDPSFPWYASDWLGSNKRAMMSLEQQGAYMNLLCRQWTDPQCSLPDSDEALAVLSGMNQGWLNGGGQLVRDCFPPHPNQNGRLANKRMLELRAERDAWIEKSRQGGRKSAHNKKIRQLKGGSTTVGTKRQPKRNSPSPSSSPSSSSSSFPSPSSKEKDRVPTADIQAVIDHYRKLHSHSRPGQKERRLIADRIREGYTADRLCEAIDGCHKSPFHCGKNDHQKKYQSLELIVRDSKHVADFLEMFHGNGRVAGRNQPLLERMMEELADE